MQTLIEKTQSAAESQSRSVIGAAIVDAVCKAQGKQLFIRLPDGSQVDMANCSVSEILSSDANSKMEAGRKFLLHIAALHAALLRTDAGTQWLIKNRYSRSNDFMEIILIARSEIKILDAVALVSNEPVVHEPLKSAIAFFSPIGLLKPKAEKHLDNSITLCNSMPFLRNK